MIRFFYICLLVGFAGCSLQSGDIKSKIIGLLLLIVNAIMFYPKSW